MFNPLGWYFAAYDYWDEEGNYSQQYQDWQGRVAVQDGRSPSGWSYVCACGPLTWSYSPWLDDPYSGPQVPSTINVPYGSPAQINAWTPVGDSRFGLYLTDTGKWWIPAAPGGNIGNVFIGSQVYPPDFTNIDLTQVVPAYGPQGQQGFLSPVRWQWGGSRDVVGSGDMLAVDIAMAAVGGAGISAGIASSTTESAAPVVSTETSGAAPIVSATPAAPAGISLPSTGVPAAMSDTQYANIIDTSLAETPVTTIPEASAAIPGLSTLTSGGAAASAIKAIQALTKGAPGAPLTQQQAALAVNQPSTLAQSVQQNPIPWLTILGIVISLMKG